MTETSEAGVVRRLALEPVHAVEGARFGDVLGWRRPLCYGGPDSAAAEYAAARGGAAVLDLSDRGVLAASGPTREKLLHNLLSNAVLGLKPGQGCLASLMDVKGHLQALLRVLVARGSVLLETGVERLPLLEDRLVFYRVGAPVRFAVPPTAVLAVLGPRAAEVLGPAGVPDAGLPAECHVEGAIAGAPVRIARASDLPAGAYVVHAAAAEAAAVWKALREAGSRALGRDAFDALRVEDGRPLYGADVGEENLLHETGLLREYHSSSKGCYLGQEVVARLEGRGGHVNKRLCGLRLGAAAQPGAVVRRDGQDVGRVTTAAASPRLGPIALAYVHRSAFEPGTDVEVGGQPARVAPLPLEGPP